jgi:radical SAM superfamily enzyme YgiQ (UPF0313 family)
MRVLLINPPYPSTFWSFNKVTQLLGKKCVLPPLGLLTVAALFPEGTSFTLVDMAAQELTESHWENHDVVFVTGMQIQQSGILNAIEEGKRRAKKVVVGGPWAFHFCDKALESGADIVVRGELESSIQELIDALALNKSGIVINSGFPELNASPVPRYDLLDLNLYMDMAVQFSRGCPFRCEFCDITLMFGRSMRTKSPQQIISELDFLYNLGWRGAIFFVDDNFIGSKVSSKALLKMLIGWQSDRGNPFEFYTQASVNLAGDDELLDLMVRAGFAFVFLGIETLDIDSLKSVGKVQNLAVDLDAACQKINRAGLQVIAGCIIGFDNEAPGADQRLIDFAVRNRIPEVFATMLQAMPGTDLWKRVKEEGRLLCTGQDSLISHTGRVNFTTTRPLQEITAEFINLYDDLYEPKNYLSRVYEHLIQMPRPSVKRNAGVKWNEVIGVIHLIARQGFLYKSRKYFWKYLIYTLFNMPWKLRSFIIYCFRAEHYYHYRVIIEQEMQLQIMDDRNDLPSEPGPSSELVL